MKDLSKLSGLKIRRALIEAKREIELKKRSTAPHNNALLGLGETKGVSFPSCSPSF